MDQSPDRPAPDAPAPKPSRARRLAPLGLLVVAAVAIYATGLHRLLSFDTLVANAGALQGFVAENAVLAGLAYVAAYVAVVALSLPGALFATLAGGFLFGGVAGGALTVVAATAGATVVFLIARTAVGDVLAKRAGGAIAKLADGFRTDAFEYLLFLRLVPAFPFFVVNLAPAILGVPLRTFVIATFFGIMPGTFAFSFIGASLGGLVAEEAQGRQACLARGGGDCAAKLDPSSLLSTNTLIAFVALGVAALLPIAVKRFRNRGKSKGKTTA